MSKKQDPDMILELIKRVDKEYKDSGFNSFFNSQFLPFNVFLIFLIVIFEGYFFYYFRSQAPQTIMTGIPTFIALLIPFLALMITLRTFADRSEEKLQVERNYYLVSRNYAQKTHREKLRIWKDLFYSVKLAKDYENPLLKAIIKMKAKNPQLALEDLYKDNKLLFSKKKLMERLFYD